MPNVIVTHNQKQQIKKNHKENIMRESKYWDDFENRINETVQSIKDGVDPKIRRVACFITDRCNFRCEYCNSDHTGNVMTRTKFLSMIHDYGNDAIIHITGGEPSTVKWLYPLIRLIGRAYRFHLNTNAYIKPPSKHLKRLKVSLDSTDSEKWDKIVGKKGAWERVVANIKEACSQTVVSITYTLSKKTFRNSIEFAKFCNVEFPGLYAVFFSVYKGTDPEYMLTPEDVEEFHGEVMPKLLNELGEESRQLMLETIDEKRRLMEGTRFEQNSTCGTCFLSMSERVISPNGEWSTCSHLYRDDIMLQVPEKRKECRYGCNRRLVAFNEEVEKRI